MKHPFVYGTLKKSHIDNPLLKEMELNLSYISECYVLGRLYMVDKYPGLIRHENEKVFGELYEIVNHDKIIPILDVYEDYFPKNLSQSLYIRESILCVSEVSETLTEAYTYIYIKDISKLKQIISGRF